jgi:KamA family protein
MHHNRLVVGGRTTHISVLPRATRKYRVYTHKDIDQILPLRMLSEDERNAMKAVAAVLPFRVNNYVIEDLIDWSEIPHDPIFQLTFPQPAMLEADDFSMMYALVKGGAPRAVINDAARQIQQRLNPHPAGQMELNVPRMDGRPLAGMQHKYRETVLFFPAPGQTCHSYCTYCFRWAQFVGIEEFKFADREATELARYVRVHPEVTSVLFTGGDPMIMKTSVLRRFIEPLLKPELENLASIRFGTKAPAYWPYRFTTDSDSDDLMRLFESIRRSGRHVAIMAHFSHPRELETPEARSALRRIRNAGAVVRCQAPLIRHVNDSADAWAEMWRHQVRAGAVPYYMFVERDTGPKPYFEVPLARALDIFNGAFAQVSGLARTVRGPSMSTTPGKVLVDGTATIDGEKVFALKFLQARDPQWVGRVFFARFDPHATWLDELRPAFGQGEFFFEPRLREIQLSNGESAR